MRWELWAVVATTLVGCRDDVGSVAGESSSSGGTSTSASASDDTRADSSGAPADETTASTSGTGCASNTAPTAPTIVEPEVGRLDILADSLTIGVSAFDDPDPADTMGMLVVELWTIKAGELDSRVWAAAVTDDGPLTLADGTFEDDFARGLDAWEDYGVRARHSDEPGECNALSEWSDWSEVVEFRTDDGSSELFDESVVRDFYLDIGPESWDLINAEAYPPGCVPHERSYYGGTLRYEDQVFDNVGIKIKGGCGSSQDLSGKASFKVNLEWDDPAVPGCPADRRLLGEKKFGFHNGVQDDTASHERLGYALFRELGVPAPRAASVRIFVNDELWGLYTHVESIDRRFLSRWFGSKEGMLYEGTYWCDLIDENIGPGDEDDGHCLTREFSPDECSAADPEGDPLDFSMLHELIEQIEQLDALPDGAFLPAAEAFMEFDRFLTMWAIESVLSHWDNYAFSITNNYRVYHDPSTDRWSMISTGALKGL